MSFEPFAFASRTFALKLAPPDFHAARVYSEPIELSRLPDGTFQLVFTNSSATSFSVVACADPSIPLTNWTALGTASQTAGNVFHFIDTGAKNYPQRFYLLRTP